MSSAAFYIVDVFSTVAYKGNPLAVVDNLQNDLSETQMKLIARQFNLSETTFYCAPTDSGATYKLRSFLPDGKEVFGAGHNILGAWWHLAHIGLASPSKSVTSPRGSTDDAKDEDVFTFNQQLGPDIMPVKIIKAKLSPSSISVSIRQSPPAAHRVHPDPAGLALAIGLAEEDIGLNVSESGSRPQPQVMSTSSTHHLIVPISSLEALDRAVFQRDKILEQLALVDTRAYGLFLFTAVPNRVNTYRARFFSPGMSGEDPATGSAAGPLSAYLYNNNLLQLEGEEDRYGEISVQQGLSVGRACTIRVGLSKSQRVKEELNVDIIGTCTQVAEGRMRVPDSSLAF